MHTKTLAEIIPADLNMTTGQRCALVADIIEFHPEQWDQEVWAAGDDRSIIGTGASCNSSCCAFGWAIAATHPKALSSAARREIQVMGRYFTAGEESLGLEWDAAYLISDTDNKREPLVAALRFLATVPEGERTAALLQRAGFTVTYLTGRDEG
jgi:hypothetical protein